MIYYLLVLLSALGNAISFAFLKVYQVRVGDKIVYAFRKGIPTGFVAALLFLVVSGFRLGFSLFTLVMAFLLALVTFLSGLVLFKGYAKGSLSVITMFQMQGGMLLPFFYGIIFRGEALTWACGIGILLMVFSLIPPVMRRKKEDCKQKTSKSFFLLCLAIFFLNGLSSVISFIHSNSSLASSTNDFLIYYNLILGLMYCFALFLKRREKVERESASSWALVIFATLFASAASFFLLTGAAHIPAVAIYPIVTGGIVILTSLAGALFFGDKLNKWTICGVALTFLATFLFLF